MTFQVGLVCRDGIVLAGDTRVIGGDGLWSSSQTKFLFDGEEMNIAIATAGSSVSKRVAQDFLKAEWSGDLSQGQKIAEDVYKNEFKHCIDNEPLWNQTPTLLIVVRSRERRMFHFCTRTRTEVAEIKDKIVSGDGTNSGVFILERYYHPSLSVANATRIAALAVWFTGKLNPYVGGLEVVRFADGQKPYRLTDGEIAKLLSWCETTDHRIGELTSEGSLRD